METKNALNQNPEETEKTVQEENSNPKTEPKEKKVKPAVKKSKATKLKTEKGKKKNTSTEEVKSVEEGKPVEEVKPEEEVKPVKKPSKKTEKQSEQLEVLNVEHDEDEDEEDHGDHHDDPEKATPLNYDELSLEDLLTHLEEIVQEEEIVTLKKKVALIKVAFLKKHKTKLEEQLETIAGSEDEEKESEDKKDDLETRFNEAFQVYSEKRKAYQEQLEIQKQQNLETKKLILEELKALIESEESLKKTYDDFKDLQEKWKAVGMVPKGEVNNLWQNYHFYVEKFFDKVKINRELRDLDLKKNLEAKIDLCEKVEELLIETSILKSFKKLQEYHRQWKETGPVPQDKKDELWERFKSSTEKINLGRRDHYDLRAHH